MSKFYNALSDLNSLNASPTKDPKPKVTLGSLIEVAKDVSDRMILSKNQVEIHFKILILYFCFILKLNMRINENKQLLASLKNSAQNQISSEKSSLDKKQFLTDSSEAESKYLNAPVYAVLTKDASKRPKSTCFTDWRGFIGRPSTGRKTK